MGDSSERLFLKSLIQAIYNEDYLRALFILNSLSNNAWYKCINNSSLLKTMGIYTHSSSLSVTYLNVKYDTIGEERSIYLDSGEFKFTQYVSTYNPDEGIFFPKKFSDWEFSKFIEYLQPLKFFKDDLLTFIKDNKLYLESSTDLNKSLKLVDSDPEDFLKKALQKGRIDITYT